MQNNGSGLIDILIVEDNPGDARLIKEIMQEGNSVSSLHIVEDGVAAMKFLRKEGDYTDSPNPDLIILDLNLPKKDGREVLAEIKADNHLKHIPVVIMTMSQAEEDIIKSYSLHANCYITKPLDLEQFIKAVRSIEEFWFTTVKLPRKK